MIGWKDFVWIAVVAMTGCFSPVGVVSPDAVTDYIRHNLPLTVRTGSSGGVSVSKEYATPRMLGWTAGVYVACGDGEDLTNVGLKSESHEKERKTQHE